MEDTITRRSNNSSSEESSNVRYERRIVRDIHNDFRSGFEKIGQDATEVIEQLKGVAELKELTSMEIEKPSFPVILFSVALIFDLIDIGQFTGVWWFVMVVINFCFGVYLFFWMIGKLSSLFKGGSKFLFATRGGKYVLIKTARKFLTRRLAYIFIFNLIPLLGVFASNAWFVFLAHNHMNKLAQMYIDLIEDIAKKIKRL